MKEYKYKLIHMINNKKVIHTELLYYNDINKAYKYFKNTFGNDTFLSLQIGNKKIART